MPTPSEKFKIAAVQASPVFLDREETVKKACRLIAEAGSQGARLIVFPESFIPAYPDWVWAVPPGREKILNELYAEIDPRQMRGPKWMLDVAGHYARPDVFELIVHREAHPMIKVVEAPPPGEKGMKEA